MKKTNPSSIIYSPADVAAFGQDYIGWKRDNKEFGVPFFSKKMGSRVYPMFPGEVASIIARPGHGKTGIMMAWARQRSRWLQKNNILDRAVIYATWEQSVEELHSFYIAAEQQLSVTKMARGELSDAEMDRAMQASADRIKEPLWFIGHSTMRKSGRQPITPETLTQALENIPVDVDILYIDYLQRMQPDQMHESPTVMYSRMMDYIKDLALGFGIPIVVGVQAAREVEQLKVQIPDMHHAQWTSNIEQSSDRVFSAVRPRRYKQEGEFFGSHTVTGHNQLLMSVLKQKLGEANFAEWLSFNPIFNRLDEKELEHPVPDYGG